MKMKIEQIKELSETDVRGAKNELAEYAEKEFSINLRKNKSLENMLIDLEDELSKTEDKGVGEIEDETQDTEIQDEAEVAQEAEEIRQEVEQPKTEVKQYIQPTKESKKLDLHVFTSYLTVPYWIVDWIQETNDWKDKKCPWKGSEKFINTILYHISKYGQIEIRETRNSKFITLT